MSTKTTFKRVALVAVAALGLGVVTSVAPASAANADITAIAAGTPAPARIGVSTGATTITVTVPTGSTGLNVTAQITSAPSTSASAGLIFSAASTNAPANPTFTAITTKNANKQVGTLNDAGAVANASFTGFAGSSTKLTLKLTPDVEGTYQILVAAGGSATAGYSAGLLSTVYSITTTGAPTAITAAAVAGAVVEGGTKGQLWKVTLKDSNGNATVLGSNESIAVAESDANVKIVGAADNASSTAITVLGSDVSGAYYIRAVDAGTVADGATVVTLSGAGLLASSLTTNFSTTNLAAEAAVGTETITVTTSTSYATTGLAFNADYGSAGSSHSFTVTKAAAPAADVVNPILVTPPTGADYAYNTVVTVLKAATTGKFSVSQALASTDTDGFTVAIAASQGTKEVSYLVAAPGTIAVQGSAAVLSATAGKNTFTVLVKNQYGAAMQYQAVSVSVAGRNTVASTALGVTDANGLISYSLTDAGTTGTKDTISFVTGSLTAAVAVVTYGTVTVDSVTVSGGSKAETVAGSTLTAINGADNGPETSRVAIKAVVKDASGNLLAGVPVVFTVSAGAIYKTAAIDYATVYTGTDGSASTSVFNWIPGTQTITATAGGKSSTDYLTWAATDASTARVLSATATGDIVSLKVVDRFGNAVKGVTVDLSRSGTGLFGNGSSTQSVATDKTGTADVRFTGTGTVVAELGAAYAQAADKAGEIAAVAVTAAVAGTTKGTGASLAPAGVNKVTVAISEGDNATLAAATAASDAAAEATDAANAATDAANAAAEAADAATAAAQDAADAVAALSTQVSEMIDALKKQITALTNLVIKIQKKVKA